MTNAVKEIKTMKILELWRNKQVSYIRQQYQEFENNLYKDDSLYKKVYDLALQIATEIAKDDSSVLEKRYKTLDEVATVILGYVGKEFCLHTKDTMDKLDTGTKEYIATKERLHSDFHEIKAMLSACDTYEQEMEMLKNYGVVRTNGKLNVPTV